MLLLFLESVINMSLCILAINSGKLEEIKKKILVIQCRKPPHFNAGI